MKILKWILGLLAGLGGILALFAGNKNKKVKQIKDDIKTNEKETKKIDKKIEEVKSGQEAMKETQKNYEKTVAEMKKKKQLYEPKDVDAKEAADFLKKYSKKGKK